MKISKGSTYEIVISLLLICSAIFTNNNMIWNVAAGAIGSITLIHSLYLLFKQKKINKSKQHNKQKNKIYYNANNLQQNNDSKLLQNKNVKIVLIISILINISTISYTVDLQNKYKNKNTQINYCKKILTKININQNKVKEIIWDPKDKNFKQIINTDYNLTEEDYQKLKKCYVKLKIK